MLILFDLDDTLMDDTAATRAAVNALHAHLESDQPLEHFRARWLGSLRRHFARYVAGAISFEEQRRSRIRDVVRSTLSDSVADELFAKYLLEYEGCWALFDDVLPCLDALQGHVLGVVSNGNASQQREKLSRLGIVDRFACVVISEELGFGKPDSRIFLAACDRCGVAPADTIHVGDRLDADVLGAARAGLRPIWLDRQSGGSARARPHDFPVIGTLADLPRAVAEAVCGAGRMR